MPFDMREAKNSSNLQAYGYDPDSNILRVKYLTGKTYDYHNVPPKMYDTMLESHSVGSYIGRIIKPGCICKPVEDEPRKQLPQPPY